jgi:hypothetical protein
VSLPSSTTRPSSLWVSLYHGSIRCPRTNLF